MRFCSLFKSFLFWFATLLCILGAWTAGSVVAIWPGFTVSGSMVLPLGAIILVFSVVVHCPFNRRNEKKALVEFSAADVSSDRTTK